MQSSMEEAVPQPAVPAIAAEQPAEPEKDKVRLFLARHGQTTCNKDHIMQGSGYPSELNEEGIKQGRCLGRRLAEYVHCSCLPPLPLTSHGLLFFRESFDLVISSKLLRARQTAALVLEFQSSKDIEYYETEGLLSHSLAHASSALSRLDLNQLCFVNHCSFRVDVRFQ